MGLIKQDTRKRILKFLIENKDEQFTAYQVTKLIYKISDTEKIKIVSRCPFVNKILNAESEKGIVEKNKSKNCYYSINHNFLDIQTDIILNQIQCPKCEKKYLVEKFQQRKTCEKCKNKSGKPFRFWINKKHIKQIRVKSFK